MKEPMPWYQTTFPLLHNICPLAAGQGAAASSVQAGQGSRLTMGELLFFFSVSFLNSNEKFSLIIGLAMANNLYFVSEPIETPVPLLLFHFWRYTNIHPCSWPGPLGQQMSTQAHLAWPLPRLPRTSFIFSTAPSPPPLVLPSIFNICLYPCFPWPLYSVYYTKLSLAFTCGGNKLIVLSYLGRIWWQILTLGQHKIIFDPVKNCILGHWQILYKINFLKKCLFLPKKCIFFTKMAI